MTRIDETEVRRRANSEWRRRQSPRVGEIVAYLNAKMIPPDALLAFIGVRYDRTSGWYVELTPAAATPTNGGSE